MEVVNIGSFLLLIGIFGSNTGNGAHPLTGRTGLRVMNGRAAKNREFPSQVLIFVDLNNGGEFFCGGSMLTSKWIMTAAHCILPDVRLMTVTYGSLEFRNTNADKHRVTRTAVDWHVHHKFKNVNEGYDIAVIKVNKPVKKSATIQPAILPSRRDQKLTYVGKTGIVSGWGRTDMSFSGIARYLQAVDQRITKISDCRKRNRAFTDSHICAYRLSAAPCKGDSGGPFYVNGVQIGIVSFGTSPNCSKSFIGYTRVDRYLDWIKANTDRKV